MKKILNNLALLVSIGILSGCNSLDIPPINIVNDDDIFKSQTGVEYYMSSIYSRMPIEDFKYAAKGGDGFNVSMILSNINYNTGEGLNNTHISAGGIINPAQGYWKNAYILIRNINHFIEMLPQYKENFNNDQTLIDHWLGEARFIRAMTYFALVKRYGGVPIITDVQEYPGQGIENLLVERNSEEEVYDFIEKDLNFAIDHMREVSDARGRANRNVVLAFKSRIMLFAGSIAKYNQIAVVDKNSNKQLTGIPADRANEFFKKSYDAAVALEGKYDLYMSQWKDGDKIAQADNFAALFQTVVDNKECIFAREYMYPNSAHSFNAYFVPYQLMGPSGYSSSGNPTLDFVELFDGFPKNANGTINTLDADNRSCKLFDRAGAIFDDCEPRLRGTVLLPDQTFGPITVDLRRGIYTGSLPVEPSEIMTQLVTSAENNPDRQTLFMLKNGREIYPCGLDGPAGNTAGTTTGFHLRKYVNPNSAVENNGEGKSEQPWIEMRYAEVLLNLAEAALELHQAGVADLDYQEEAFEAINRIRLRAGATLLVSKSELDEGAVSPACYIEAPNRGLQIIRTERRKELAFENKIWWDMIRWRSADVELNARVWRKLNPILVNETADENSNGKYILFADSEDSGTRFTFQPKMYYEPIPEAELQRNPNLTPNQSN